jgi:tetratricopeptide (TPR) repeat protein
MGKKLSKIRLLNFKKHKSDKSEAYFYNGFNLSKSEKHPEAIEAYDLAIRNVPTVLAYYNKGVSLSLLEDYRKAIISYDKALEINSYFVPALNNKVMPFIIYIKFNFIN